jgi:hypothetical protein
MSKLLRLTTVSLIALMGLLGSAVATMAAPVSQEGTPFGAAQGATGTVVVTDYICDGQTGVVWGGAAGTNCYAGSAGFAFYLIGDGTDESWSLSVNGSGSISLPVGTYEVYENIYWTAGTVEVTAGGTSNLTVLHPGAALPPPPPAEGAVSVSDYVCTGQTGVTWFGTPDANCEAGAATFYFYLIGDGTDEYWSLQVNGTSSRALPVGTYEVYESVYWTSFTVEILEGQTTSVNVLHPGAPIVPDDGTVSVSKYDCRGLDAVTWGGTPDANCEAGSGTFYFYLIGDGTDEFWSLNVNGTGSIALTPGTYDVYEGGRWSMSTVEVLEGETTNLNVLNPGGPLTGSVSLSKYICNGVDTVIWGGSPDGNCVPDSGVFEFYLIGDGTDDYWTLNVNGTGTIDLPVGTYEVWETGTWSQGSVSVVADDTIAINVLNPGGPLPGTVTVNKYDCQRLDTVTWNGSPDGNCTAGDATFFFYLVGDGTDDFWMLAVDGSGTIELPAGTYEVWENGSWSRGEVVVPENGTTTVNVLNPAP